MDVCSQDSTLESLFSDIAGRKNEGLTSFFTRTLNDTCTRIMEPKKASYITRDLTLYEPAAPSGIGIELGPLNFYQLTEFTVISNGMKLHCALWKSSAGQLPPDSAVHSNGNPNHNCEVSQVPCIIYTHTNTRSLADATELLPLAEVTGFHLLAFDLPGAGLSEGKLSASCATIIRLGKSVRPI
jgi:hypothetical protein